MYALYKLPRFMDYLYEHYNRYYKLYSGRLIELFPSFESTEDSLAIVEDDSSSEEENEEIYRLWIEFR